jgi:phosphate transport system substrate-binding protein
VKKIFLIVIICFVFVDVYLIFTKASQNLAQQSQKQSYTITIKGSDTEVQMVSILAQEFSNKNSGIKISVTGGGSGVGIAALLNKEIDIANSSRKITKEEIDNGLNKNLHIQEFIIARDGLAIIINPKNNVQQLTLGQLGKIYKGEIKNWKEVNGPDRPISLYGRQSTSGTYTFFRDTVVKDDYYPSMLNMEGNQQIIDAVKSDEDGIGYVAGGYIKDVFDQPLQSIKIVLVAKDANTNPVSPLDIQAIEAERYPIFRPIYQYLPNVPQKGSLIYKFLQFEFSDEAQTLIAKSGFYKLTKSDLTKDLQFFQNIK